MRVYHNIPALHAYNAVNTTNNALQRSINKLSTGLRINSAADDAAGLAISEKMRAQVRGMDQAIGNAQDGINMIQTAEGGLGEVHSILQRMRELSVQSANDTLTANDRSFVQLEIDQLKEEIDRISNTTQFNKKKLLNGDAAVLWSTDTLATEVMVRGGLREIDRYGQKSAAEGNFKISINAVAGQGQIQKTDIFKVKHAVQESLKEHTVGFANFEGTIDTGVASGASVAIKIDGTEYTLQFSAAMASDAAATELKRLIDSRAGLADRVLITTGAADAFVIVARESGKSFEIGWTVTAGGAIGGAGITSPVLSLGLTEINANQDNIKSLDMNAANMMVGDYKVETRVSPHFALDSFSASSFFYNQGSNTADWSFRITAGALGVTTASVNMSLAFEVSNVDTGTNTVTFTYQYAQVSKAGVTEFGSGTIDVVFTGSGGATETYNLNRQYGGLGLTVAIAQDFSSFTVGDKAVHNIRASASANDDFVAIKRVNDTASYTPMNFAFGTGNLNNKTTEFSFFQLNTISTSSDFGDLKLSKVSFEFGVLEDAYSGIPNPLGRNYAASFEIVKDGLGDIAAGDTRIYDLDKFWDANGNFLVEDPQTITVVQGDGRKASFTIYKDDTMDSIAEKINSTIRDGLGQGALSGLEKSENFASYITQQKADANPNTPWSVAGTMVISSAINGRDGQLNFVGDEALLNALSLNVIQQSKDNQFTVKVVDAHNPEKVIAENVKITGNNLVGVVHNNIDVKFDSMANVAVDWNSAKAQWHWTSESADYETVVHLADNTTVFQIGANEKEDMGVNIANMNSKALGVANILVTDRESAARSITVLDRAIDRVSAQRANLGAYQNRLEHTISNLTTGSTNIQAAESRIRDLDMAKEMMNFTRLNILMQAGNSMLAQANQLPQNVLQLLR